MYKGRHLAGVAELGRRAGLKILCPPWRVGSIPTTGTPDDLVYERFLRFAADTADCSTDEIEEWLEYIGIYSNR